MVLRTLRYAALTAALASTVTAQQLFQAQQLRANGQYAEARDAFQSLLRAAERDNAGNSSIASILDNLGLDEIGLGRYEEAENAFNRALAVLPHGDPAVPAVKMHLGEVYMAEHRPSEAEPLLRQSAAGLRNLPGTDPKLQAESYSDLAVALAMQKKHAQAEGLLRQSLSLLETALGSNDPMLACALNPLAAFFLVSHRYEEAVSPAERSWQILQSTQETVAPADIAATMDILGQAYMHVGRLAEAESYAHQAAVLAERVYGPQHPRLGLYLQRYAAVLSAMGKGKQAKALNRRASTILEQAERGSAAGLTVNVAALR